MDEGGKRIAMGDGSTPRAGFKFGTLLRAALPHHALPHHPGGATDCVACVGARARSHMQTTRAPRARAPQH